MNDEIELLIENGNKYYVLKNNNLNLLNKEFTVSFNGKVLHREDGPALEYKDGEEEWYKYGRFHRENGPAIAKSTGDKYWYQNGEIHREGGPAIEYANGIKMWYQHDKLHREAGPAKVNRDGSKEYYLNDINISEEKFYLEKELREELRENLTNTNKVNKNKI